MALISLSDLEARAAAELRRGGPIVLVEDDRAALVASAEMMRRTVWEALDAAGLRPTELAISTARAATLAVRIYDEDVARIILPPDATSDLARAIADPSLDLENPLSGPHIAARTGDAALARAALTRCKQAQLLPAAAMRPFEGRAEARAAAEAHQLVWLDISTPESTARRWREVSNARVPLALAESRLRVFRRVGWDDEHYALEIGDPPRTEPVLTRLHSACATGDLFGSLKCDCGPQLQAAIARIAAEGAGVLVYLLQEGRGIGLANKMRAYSLQDAGFDTVDANHRLGFEDDERLLTDGGEILRAMGFTSARLMTNNPKKLSALEDVGVSVIERVPLVAGETAENADYLRVKAEKSGHLL